jgi:hypothetical protein
MNKVRKTVDLFRAISWRAIGIYDANYCEIFKIENVRAEEVGEGEVSGRFGACSDGRSRKAE